jgi:hypothetical protein
MTKNKAIDTEGKGLIEQNSAKAHPAPINPETVRSVTMTKADMTLLDMTPIKVIAVTAKPIPNQNTARDINMANDPGITIETNNELIRV